MMVRPVAVGATLVSLFASASAFAAVDLSFARGTVTTLPSGEQVLTQPDPLLPDPFGLPQVSDGSLGSLQIVNDTVLMLPADGTFNYDWVTVATGARISFEGGAPDTRISLLFRSGAEIYGTIDAMGYGLLSLYGPTITFGQDAELLTGSVPLSLNVTLTMTAIDTPLVESIWLAPDIILIATSVPEPQTWAMLGLGLPLCVAALRRQRRTAGSERRPS